MDQSDFTQEVKNAPQDKPKEIEKNSTNTGTKKTEEEKKTGSQNLISSPRNLPSNPEGTQNKIDEAKPETKLKSVKDLKDELDFDFEVETDKNQPKKEENKNTTVKAKNELDDFDFDDSNNKPKKQDSDLGLKQDEKDRSNIGVGQEKKQEEIKKKDSFLDEDF